ncbi:MAG: type VI secretion lipoprotein TssJ [Desulfovibrio sp.]|nr:type VI secretion lipoprotein TssJ [Desulfovibrio sp.]
MGTYANHSALSISAGHAFSLLLTALLSLGLAAGCGSAPPPKPALESEDPGAVLWSYGEKALHLRLSAARDLNSFEDKAHTLQLCVYQLDKRDAFDLLKNSQDGIGNLLRCSPFDPSVKGMTRIFLQPGETAAYDLDRAEGALFVGVVCGYFESTPEQSARLWQIPLNHTQSGHLFWKSTVYSAGGLILALHLNAHALQEDSAGGKGQGGSTPPAQGSTPPTQGTTPPAQGSTPPTQGSTPPTQRSTPPTQGSTPPAQGGTTPPTQGGSTPPTQGWTTPPTQGGQAQQDQKQGVTR